METSQRQLTPELFQPVGEDYKDNERIAGPSIGFWRDSWQRFKKNKASLVGLVVIVALIVVAYVAPLLVPYTPYEQDITNAYRGTSGEHLMGTDKFGRDMFVRVWEGMRVSLYIALLAALLDLVIGVPFGAISGLLIMVVLKPGIVTISVAIGIAGWTPMARIIRGRVLQLRDQEFTLASRSLGAGRRRILTKHLLPNALGLIIITLMLTIPSAIFYEAVLSFIGLGIQVPSASLGSLINDGYAELRFHSYLLWFPAAVFCLLMLSFNLLADGLRDALDPRMRK
jgi:oligopeptide transport system permease protein